jgi:hypothetical protein
MHEVHVHSLIGLRVYDAEGKSVGRIEELCVERRNDEAYVTEFLVGEYGLLERLAGGALARALLRLLPSAHRGRRIAWELLDLSDPHHPRVRVTKDALPSDE